MLNQKKVEVILSTATEQAWPYPKLFDALRDEKISHYEVAVPRHQVTYYGLEGSWAAPSPRDADPLPVAPVFDPVGVQAAVGRSQKREITYEDFLGELLKAGCSHYRVDMKSRTVSYMGDVGEKYTEEVPLA